MDFFQSPKAFVLFATLVWCSFGVSISDVRINDKILANKKVDRTVDISTSLVRIISKITLVNVGNVAASTYFYALEPTNRGSLAFIAASKTGSDESDELLDLTAVDVPEHKDEPIWEIQLPQAVEPGKTIQIEVETVFTHQLVPHPQHILQSEKQLVMYHGNHYFYSPYATTSQTTIVTLASSNIEFYTKMKPVTHSDTTVTYGPFENIDPFAYSEMVIHSENTTPFLTVTSLERSLQVSHWGNIAVEESIELRHTGAILKGPFSRYEYQREQNGVSSVRSFKTVLPASASDVYYRDEIGNISTSHLRLLEDAVEVDLRPRFPLFGGWKTHYIIGYNIPSYEYLFNSGSEFVLKIRFVDHIFDDMVIDEANVRVILPEGAKDITVSAPYDISRERDDVHYSYLDTVGRPVVVARKNNLVENHIQDFEVHYRFQKILMLQEPLLVVIAFYLLFLLVIFYVRLDFSISKDEANELRMRVAGLCEKVQQHHDKLFSLYQQYDAAITQFKTNKESAAFQATNKKLNAEHKSETQAIADLQGKLKQESSESHEKVTELHKLDRQMKELVVSQISYTEKFIAGKIQKSQYLELEQSTSKKKEDILEKMDTIYTAL